MRPTRLAWLFVLAVYGGTFAVSASDSEDGEQAEPTKQQDSDDTSLAQAHDEPANATIGASRVGLGGEQSIDEIPPWVSVLWCPKITNQLDGHLCGIMTYITDQTLIASNNAMYLMQEQLKDVTGGKWDGPPSGFLRVPPLEFDINDGAKASEPGVTDWKLRFYYITAIDHGLGIWRLMEHESWHGQNQGYPDDDPPRDHFFTPYDVSKRGKPMKGKPYMVVYGAETGQVDSQKKWMRKAVKISVKLLECAKGECKFETLTDGSPRHGQLCGEYSDVGAPVFTRHNGVTHIVTKLLGNGKCTTEFMALDLNSYQAQMQRALQRRDQVIRPG